MILQTRSEQACFGGKIGFYSHASTATGTTMHFGVYQPPQARHYKVPALYFLAGLTCTEETFFIKAGALKLASELGLLLVTSDTSPRGLNLPGEADAWDFGLAAGFYLDAIAQPWSHHYRMGSYVDQELPALIEANFPANPRRGIFGHSMGGHGALITALRNPAGWHSVSAFAPISNPSVVPWGEKAFGNYLGVDRAIWKNWDAAELMLQRAHPELILVDQGTADQFLAAQLKPLSLQAAAAVSGQALTLRMHEAYDHSYWFVQSFIDEHLRHHAKTLL